jgi:exopolysaccharide biosynthesis polyprenyl glycosylphosphotransferase
MSQTNIEQKGQAEAVESGELDASSRRSDRQGPLHRSWLLRRALALSDWVAMLVTLAVTTFLSREMDVSMLFWAVAISPAWLVLIKLQGLYDNDHRRIRHSTVDELPGLIAAAAIGVLALSGLLSIAPPHEPLSSNVMILAAVLLTATCFVFRALVRYWWHGRQIPARGIVIGSPEEAAMIARRLYTHPEARLEIRGYVLPAARAGEAKPGSQAAENVPLLGTVEDVERIVDELKLDRIVLADGSVTALETEWLIGQCKTAGIGLTALPPNAGLFGPTIELNRLAELPVLDFRFAPPTRSTMILKRAMDIAVSGVTLLLTAPLLLLAAVAIKFDSPGPVFFRQKRAGKDGVPFTMLKLRTMCQDAEEKLSDLVDLTKLDQPAFKLERDPRITRVGRLLRRTSLDELPQMINVLRGDMSLVGPRPEEVAVVALYDERQRVRLSVKPGLTGPMQVSGRGDLTFEERLALDRDYLDHISIRGDIALLLRTPRAILRGDGAY